MSLRILLGDDNPGVRQSVRRLIEREGLEVVAEASDGAEAVVLACALRPDIAVLDLTMPRMSGLRAAREIRRACPATGIVLLTASSTEHQIIHAFREGIGGYVVKADVTYDLVRAIHDVRGGSLFLSPRASRAVIGMFLSEQPSTLAAARRLP
jgi:DNA-binding NarL/FixJ family response regulator